MAESALIERSFQPGEPLVTQEAQGEALFLITSGRARVTRVSLGGRERVLGFLYAPAVFGEISVLSQRSRSATVVADSAVEVLMLHRAEFRQILTRYPQVLWNLARVLADRVDSLNDELIALGISTEATMAHVFVNLYRQRGAAGEPNPDLLPLNQTDLMLRLSASRETVARVVRKLEKNGLVKNEGGGVRLRSVDGLERIVHDLDE